jgi:hypothetical protein
VYYIGEIIKYEEKVGEQKKTRNKLIKTQQTIYRTMKEDSQLRKRYLRGNRAKESCAVEKLGY